MNKFVMSRNSTVYGSHSCTKLEIRGHFTMQGPQPIGDGGAPQWVADLLASNPEIQQVAVSAKNGGVVWTRITPMDDAQEKKDQTGSSDGND